MTPLSGSLVLGWTPLSVERLLLLAVALFGLLPACGPKDGVDSTVGLVVRATPDADAARAQLEDATASLDVTTRRFALVSLMALDDEAGGGSWAARGLWDPEPAVQRSTISALDLRLPEADTVSVLQAFVARPGLDPYVRCSAAGVLARAGDQSTLPHVQEAMSAASAAWQAAPCALAAAQMGDAGALQVLQASLREGELPLDMHFLNDLGRSGLSQVSPALREGLELMEEEVELAVAAALLELGDEAGATMLRRALSGNDPVRQLEAVDFLLESSSERANVLLRRASGEVGLAASLALIAKGQDLPYLAIESLLSNDREIRALACLALGRWLEADLDAPRRAGRLAHEALLHSLLDPEEQVRLEAIRALGVHGRSADASALAPLARSDASGWQGVVASAALLSLVQAPEPP